ncbi:MAG: TolC family protein [Xanthomonadaceae bacterium]|jgi:outer membrane protein TolC|nr:TolC family protein [Xanthomonadaceae bacterium]
MIGSRIRPFIALLAAWPLAVVAQDYLPPDPAVHTAITQQAEVLAAGARTDAAQAQARALAAGPHEFSLNASPQRRRTGNEGNFREWEAGVSRTLRMPGKAKLDREIGRHGAASAGLRWDDARHQAARRLLTAWMDHLRTGQAAAEARRQRELLQEQRDAMNRQVELGDSARLDLNLLEAELAQADAAQWQAEAAWQSTRLTLLNDFPQIPLPERICNLPDPTPLPGDDAAWIARIVGRSHEIGAANEDALQQESIAARARAERMPDPTIGLSMTSERDGEERVLGVTISVPLGGRARSATAVAENATAQALHDDALAMRRDIEREARLTVLAADNRLRQWQAQHQARQATDIAGQRMYRAWELGEASLAERLLAERNSRQAALAEANARVDALEARLKVMIDSHELWHVDEDVSPNVAR